MNASIRGNQAAAELEKLMPAVPDKAFRIKEGHITIIN